MSQIPDKSIQKKLITLLKKIRDNDANMSLEINELFDSVILDISNYLSNRWVRQEKQSRPGIGL